MLPALCGLSGGAVRQSRICIRRMLPTCRFEEQRFDGGRSMCVMRWVGNPGRHGLYCCRSSQPCIDTNATGGSLTRNRWTTTSKPPHFNMLEAAPRSSYGMCFCVAISRIYHRGGCSPARDLRSSDHDDGSESPLAVLRIHPRMRAGDMSNPGLTIRDT